MQNYRQPRFLLVCCLGLQLGLLSSAQETAAQSSNSTLSSETAGITIHGTVLNSVTGQPVARALVSLDINGLSTLTDNEGRFSFDNVAGSSLITCRRPGYSEAGSANDSGGDRVQTSIQVGAGMPALTLELQPQGAILGQVLLSGDDPPEDLRVQLLQKRIHEGFAQWSTVRTAPVTSDGRFRFGNLQPGSYLVHIAASIDSVPAPLSPSAMDQPRTGYVAAYAPGVPDMAAAQVIPLTGSASIAKPTSRWWPASPGHRRTGG